MWEKVVVGSHSYRKSEIGRLLRILTLGLASGVLLLVTTSCIAPDTTSSSESPPPSPLPALGKYDYAEVLRKSILFYEAQRSGKLPSNNRIPWRSDSALNDKGVYHASGSEDDLTGGWYEAGNNMKFNFPKAASVTFLTWGILEFEEGYKKAGQLGWALEQIKWETDYILKASAHAKDNFLWAQVGDPDIDFKWWGRPEDMTMSRPAFYIDKTNPGSDLAGEFAAALAAASIMFKRHGKKSYADKLLSSAKSCYAFAEKYQGYYHEKVKGAEDWYKSHGYADELAWGASWLYQATREASYLAKARKYFSEASCDDTAMEFSWDEKCPGVGVLLAKFTKGESVYVTATERFLNYWLPPGVGSGSEHVTYTPKGLAWEFKWGSLAYTANTSQIALIYRQHLEQLGEKAVFRSKLLEFAIQQMHYILGDAGHSFVVGFGYHGGEYFRLHLLKIPSLVTPRWSRRRCGP